MLIRIGMSGEAEHVFHTWVAPERIIAVSATEDGTKLLLSGLGHPYWILCDDPAGDVAEQWKQIRKKIRLKSAETARGGGGGQG